MAILRKKAMLDILTIPLLKSRKLAERPQFASVSNARGALKATPNTKATVRLAVKKEATIPIASMLKPTKKYPM
jgi:hypothetical protein